MVETLRIKREETSLRNTVKHYLKRAKEIESYLSKRPKEWGRFQVEFNAEIDSVFRNIMEWVRDWYLVYRSDDAFREIFINAGFTENQLDVRYEQQGVLQYIIARNKH